jgi:hypothetical protein
MMPFVIDDESTIPELVVDYLPIIEACSNVLDESHKGKVFYLTVQVCGATPAVDIWWSRRHTAGERSERGLQPAETGASH